MAATGIRIMGLNHPAPNQYRIGKRNKGY